MSDSSEDEDLSRFKDVIDTSFNKLISESRGEIQPSSESEQKFKSERYLEESSHYNDVKVPAILQNKIGAKLSEIIEKNIKFVEVESNHTKKPKIKGGVKLFKDSPGFLSCEEAKDTYTKNHNMESKKLKASKRKHGEDNDIKEEDKLASVVVSGEHILSKEETKSWKSRRKEKLFKYKAQGKSKALTLI